MSEKIVYLEWPAGDYAFRVGKGAAVGTIVKSIRLEKETPSFLRYVIDFEDGSTMVIEGTNILTKREKSNE